jgi:hypothetical protein
MVPLNRLLSHIDKYPNVWFATGKEIAEHWRVLT